MSCKGILPQTRNCSGQIEDKCKKKPVGSLGFRRNLEYSSAADCLVVPESNQRNQDVAESFGDGEKISASVLEITPSSNFVLSSNADVPTDFIGVSVDDWFKHRNDAAMDLNSVLPADGIENNDLEGYHFLASKENVDMCIVTNICDMGLGFDLPVNICDKNDQSISECGSEEKIVNSFEQTSFLDDLTRNDLLDKSMLIKVDNSDLSEKCGFLKDVGSYVLGSQDHEEKESKENEWDQNGDSYSQSLPVTLTDTSVALIDAEKVKWEALSVISQQSCENESEKEVDFSEFSLLTFQVDPSEGIDVMNTEVGCVNERNDVPENTNVPDNMIVSETYILPDTPSIPYHIGQVKSVKKVSKVSDCESIHSKPIVEQTVKRENSVITVQTEPPVLNKSGCKRRMTNILQKNTSHPRSLLRPQKILLSPKPVIEPDSLIKKVSETCNLVPTAINTDQEGNKKAPSMTIIAISTDKSKNTTEIVINTSTGEQKFKGRTSDFIRATSNLNHPVVKAKIGQSLSLTPAHDELSDEPAAVPVAEADEAWLEKERCKVADEAPIAEALAQLGIDTAALQYVSAVGQKVWPCPTVGCSKRFPRQSLLKVHILTHYGVRPYRCDVPGCHWTFYTFVKLKRHKETHLKRKAFVCPVASCGHRFTTIYNLKTHRKLHERPAKLQCPVSGCDAHFQTKRAVELHVKKHGISHAPYQCQFAGCGKRYYSSNTLNSHARRHTHREEEVRCQWPSCGKWFDKPCRLRAHVRTHTGDKPYPCTFQGCGWAFSSASKLKRHQQKHTNERRFRCAVDGCGKSFMRSEHLREHAQTHAGERSYECTVENCGVKFTAKSSLYVHLKKHKQQQQHQPPPPPPLAPVAPPTMPSAPAPAPVTFHCPVEACARRYSCKASLRQHMLRHHTPLLASDASQLDLLTSMFLNGATAPSGPSGPNGPNGPRAPRVSGAAAAGSTEHNSLLMSGALLEGDVFSTYSSEFINTDLLSGPAISNLLVVTSPEGSLQAPAEEGTWPVGRRQHGGCAPCVQQQMAAAMATSSSVEVVTEDPSCRAARTTLTYQDVVNRRAQRRTTGGSSSGGEAVVAGGGGALAGLRDPVAALRLPPDMAGLLAPAPELGLLLQEDSGLQVLLLDGSEAQTFPESTINLRDLE